MFQEELLYAYSSVAIAATLFTLIIFFNEIGFQAGRFVQTQTDSEVKALTGSIQGSILGLLALLLGFTFSMSMQRFDNRSMAVIDEANAIGTVMLRIELLPAAHRPQAYAALHNYIDLRVGMSSIDLSKRDERKRFNQQIASVQGELWSLATSAANEDPRPVTSGAYITALNQLIDSQGKRSALQQMHVPEVVLLLLFIVFISSGSMLGYSSGLSGNRILVPIFLISLLITLIVFIIIDLDRPKRGLIQVNQDVIREFQLDTK